MVKLKTFQIDLSQQFEHLDSSPVVEAVIHWAARAEKPFHEEALKQTLQERLTEYPQVRPQRWRQMESMLAADGSARQSFNEGLDGFRLTSDDKLFVVQFTRNGLVFSRMAPYPEWQAFSDAAVAAWKVYCELADPAEVQRLGVRFINHIPIQEVVEVKRYLSQPPKCLEGMGLPSEHFMYQSTHQVPDQPYGINITRAVPPPKFMADGKMALVVDIDAFTRTVFGVSEQHSREHLGNLRWLKDKAFFSLMTKRALKGFAVERDES